MSEMVDIERYFVNQFPGYDGRTLLDENGCVSQNYFLIFLCEN